MKGSSVRSNEFKGATLAETVRNATAAYRKHGFCEHKNQRRCNDLILSISSLSNLAFDLASDAQSLEREAEALRREARNDILNAAFAALGGFIAALARLRRVLKVIERATRNKKLNRDEIFELLAAAGVLGSLALSVSAALKLLDAEKLVHQAETLAQQSESLGKRLEALQEEYDRLGCGENPAFTGV